jgi:hypothetical protein
MTTGDHMSGDEKKRVVEYSFGTAPASWTGQEEDGDVLDPEVMGHAQVLKDSLRLRSLGRGDGGITNAPQMAMIGASLLRHPEFREPLSPGHFTKLVAQKINQGAVDLAYVGWLLTVGRAQTMQVLASLRWVADGLQRVRMSHKYAAALLATSIPDEVCDCIIAPWNTFVIEIPDKLLFATDKDGRIGEMLHVCVLRTDELISYLCPTTTGALLNGTAPDFRSLANTDTDDLHVSDFGQDALDGAARTAVLIGRLVSNVCLAMSNPANLTFKGAHRIGGNKNRRTRGLPLVHDYVVGQPISLDCRAAVAAYSRGERPPPSVQVLVRGHWKRQPCGPGRANRKVIHIEPYWRGPDDAPIKVRPIDISPQESSDK